MIFPAARDQGDQAVVAAVRPNGRGGGAGDGDPPPSAPVELRQQTLQCATRIPVVEGIGTVDPLPVRAHQGQGNRHRSDIDA